MNTTFYEFHEGFNTELLKSVYYAEWDEIFFNVTRTHRDEWIGKESIKGLVSHQLLYYATVENPDMEKIKYFAEMQYWVKNWD